MVRKNIILYFHREGQSSHFIAVHLHDRTRMTYEHEIRVFVMPQAQLESFLLLNPTAESLHYAFAYTSSRSSFSYSFFASSPGFPHKRAYVVFLIFFKFFESRT